MAALLEKKSAVVSGVLLTYRERAAAVGDCGAPLFMLHGLLASAKTFRSLIAQLPEDRRIVALDMPGDSDASRDLGFGGLAALVAEFASTVGLERPILLGHSHGGAVALTLQSARPWFACGMVLLCPAHPFLFRERKLVAFYTSAVGAVFARLLPWLPHPVQLLGFRRMLGRVGRERPVRFRAYRQAMREPGLIRSVMTMLGSWNADMVELAVALGAQPIDVPVLLVWGDEDLVVPLSTAEALKPLLRQWEMVVLPGVGHLPNDEAPEQCGALMNEWFIHQRL